MSKTAKKNSETEKTNKKTQKVDKKSEKTEKKDQADQINNIDKKPKILASFGLRKIMIAFLIILASIIIMSIYAHGNNSGQEKEIKTLTGMSVNDLNKDVVKEKVKELQKTKEKKIKEKKKSEETIKKLTEPEKNPEKKSFHPVKAVDVPDNAGNLTIHFIDVGHGDSILIVTPNEATMLIDGGYEDAPRLILDYMKNNSIPYLDYVIATHHDQDHIGGLDYILKRMKYAYRIYDNGQPFSSENDAEKRSYKSYKSVAGKFNFTVINKETDVTFDENIKVTLIPPYVDGYFNNTNDNSIITLISYYNTEFLLMGDCSFECEQKIMKDYDLSADVIKIGHHGASDATSEELLSKVKPKIAVISTGNKEKFGHPHNEVLDLLDSKGIMTLRTDLDGNIKLISNGNSVFFEAEEIACK